MTAVIQERQSDSFSAVDGRAFAMGVMMQRVVGALRASRRASTGEAKIEGGWCAIRKFRRYGRQARRQDGKTRLKRSNPTPLACRLPQHQITFQPWVPPTTLTGRHAHTSQYSASSAWFFLLLLLSQSSSLDPVDDLAHPMVTRQFNRK